MTTQEEQNIDYWARVEGGFRGSVMIRIGALITALGSLLNLGAQLLPVDAGPSPIVTTIAWLLYIIGLWFLAAGFFWVGSHPYFTRFSFVIGVLHAAHGAQLLVLLFTFAFIPIPVVQITIARLAVTLLFAYTEREWLAFRTQAYLVVAVSLQLIKTLGRTLGYTTDLGNPYGPLLDASLLLILTAVMLHLSNVVRLEEDEWAEIMYQPGDSDLSDFNNPEHEWNKAKTQAKKKKQR